MIKLDSSSIGRFCLKKTDFHVGIIGQIDTIAEDITSDELMEVLSLVVLKTRWEMSDEEDQFFQSLLEKPSEIHRYKVELKPEFMEEGKRKYIWALTTSLSELMKSMEHPGRYTFFRLP